jgi:capsular exopolysaccharide synthesis family protein
MKPIVTPLSDSTSSTIEAFRGLRAALHHVMAEQGIKSLVVGSPSAGDGKTVTAVNLAAAFAMAGSRVILVSADPYRRTVEQYFPGQNGVGLADVLSGVKPAHEVLRPTQLFNLELLDRGKVNRNERDMLATERMREVVVDLEHRTDVLIFDTAPVLAASDVLSLAPMVGGVLLVANARTSTSTAVQEACNRLLTSGATLLGTVLNRWRPGDDWDDVDYVVPYRESNDAQVRYVADWSA